MEKGLFSFLLVLALIPFYLCVLEFNAQRLQWTSQSESVLLQIEEANYIRTELEQNIDKIVEEALREALAAKKTVSDVKEFAEIILPEAEALALLDLTKASTEEITALSIAIKLENFFTEIKEKRKQRKLDFFVLELSPQQYSRLLELDDKTKNRMPANVAEIFTLIRGKIIFDEEKNEASCSFSQSNQFSQNKIIYSLIRFPDVNAVFMIPAGYKIKVKGEKHV